VTLSAGLYESTTAEKKEQGYGIVRYHWHYNVTAQERRIPVVASLTVTIDLWYGVVLM
jgi:hypothetical protein